MNDGLLVYSADRRTLGFVGAYFLLLVATWLAYPLGPLVFTPLLIALCACSWICAVITHNTIHTPIFRSEGLNRLFQVVLTLTYGHPVSSYVSGHNLSHHMYAQKERDIMRTYKVRSRFNIINLMLFFPTVIIGIFKSDFLFAKAMKTRIPRWSRQFNMESAALVIVTVGLFILDWRMTLLVWYVPHIFAAWGIITINYLQHDGCDDDDPVNNSRNFVGRAFGWWTFNNGFHGVHHRYPELHWSLCREVHEREFSPTIDPRLEQTSLFVYLVKNFVYPGIRRRYDGKPVELPPKTQSRQWWPDADEPMPNISFGAVGLGTHDDKPAPAVEMA